jgi:hypothetical membrane protein
MSQATPIVPPTPVVTMRLLGAGALAASLYIFFGVAQILFREGFDVRRHALSQLANGDWGFVQTANFLICGLLVLAGALGVRRATKPGANSLTIAILLALYGLGLIGAGIFPADPGRNFPPGAPEKTSISQAGLLHFVFGGLGFYAITAASFVFAWRAFRKGSPLFAIWSVAAGALFFASFVAIASGPPSETVMLCFYCGVALIWIWHCSAHLLLYGNRSA